MSRSELKFFINPLYWPLWLLAGILRLLVFLPYKWLMYLGVGVGRLLYWFPSYARSVIKININLCFPEYSKQQQKQLLKKNCESMGMALFETLLAWWGSQKKLRKLVHFNDYENYQQHQGAAIVITPHFLTLELVGSLAANELDYMVMYRPHRKAFLEFFTLRHRKAHFVKTIPSHDMRGMLRAVKTGGKVLFLPDIDAGRKNGRFVDFFGVKASTVIGTSRMAKMTGAKVMPIAFYRRDNLSGYDLHFYPPLENFPTDDVEADILRVNQLLEEMICKKPEQYLWQYRRFRTRPVGEARIYKSSRRK